MKIDTASETGKPLEFNVLNVFFSSQLPVPRRLLPCWASKSIETLSEIIREHSQLCNFIITKGTTVSIKNSIQVLKQCKYIWKLFKVFTACILVAFKIIFKQYLPSAPDCNHRLPCGPVGRGIICFISHNAPSRFHGQFPQDMPETVRQFHSEHLRAVFVLEMLCTAVKQTGQPVVDTLQWRHC